MSSVVGGHVSKVIGETGRGNGIGGRELWRWLCVRRGMGSELRLSGQLSDDSVERLMAFLGVVRSRKGRCRRWRWRLTRKKVLYA